MGGEAQERLRNFASFSKALGRGVLLVGVPL